MSRTSAPQEYVLLSQIDQAECAIKEWQDCVGCDRNPVTAALYAQFVKQWTDIIARKRAELADLVPGRGTNEH